MLERGLLRQPPRVPFSLEREMREYFYIYLLSSISVASALWVFFSFISVLIPVANNLATSSILLDL